MQYQIILPPSFASGSIWWVGPDIMAFNGTDLIKKRKWERKGQNEEEATDDHH